MTPPPYWTPADDAELDVRTDALVRFAFAHRDTCDECKPGIPWCAELAAELQAVFDWRDQRRLQSRADYLRAQVGSLAHA